MARAVIEAALQSIDGAYRSDPFHAITRNLADVTDEEWATRAANHSVDVFGTQPELSIADLVFHVGAGKLMWTNHAFGDGSLTWQASLPSSRERASVMEWLDDAHRQFVAAVEALPDDAEMEAQRKAHTGRLLLTRQIITIVVNHDLYHSGEINRQRSLIRGAEGWER